MVLILSLFVILCGSASCQQLYRVQIQDAAPVRLGSTARFRCSYLGDNITVQYVSWVKLAEDGKRTFVYEYSEYPPINQAYNDWKSRAVMKTGLSKKEERLLPRELYGREGALPDDAGFGKDRRDAVDVDRGSHRLDSDDRRDADDMARMGLRSDIFDRINRMDTKATRRKAGVGMDMIGHRDDATDRSRIETTKRRDVDDGVGRMELRENVMDRRSRMETVANRRTGMGDMNIRNDVPSTRDDDSIYRRGVTDDEDIPVKKDIKVRPDDTIGSSEENNLQNFLKHMSKAQKSLRKKELLSSNGFDDHRERIRDYMFGKKGAVNGPGLDHSPTLIPVFSSDDNDEKLKMKRNHLDMLYVNEHRFTPEPGGIGDVFRGLSPPLHHKRHKRDAPVGHVELMLSRVQLQDEATYECVVKPLGGPSMGDTITMVVQVPPENPFITSSDELPFIEGQNVTLKCQANVGKPAGSISWSILRPGADSILEVPLRDVDNRTVLHDNGTLTATSMLTLAIKEDDDGAVYRCIAASDMLGPYEARPLAQLPLTVQYPPRGGRILFDTAVGRYYCHARGKPAPTYAWIWLQPDGRQTIMSTNRYLDLRGMSESGYYRFHCLASNIIHGIRHTKVMATKLRVIAPSGPAAESARIPPAPATTTSSPPPVKRRQRPPVASSLSEKKKIYQSFVRQAPRRKEHRRKKVGGKRNRSEKPRLVPSEKVPMERLEDALNFKEHVQQAYRENILSRHKHKKNRKTEKWQSQGKEERVTERVVFKSEHHFSNRKPDPPKALIQRIQKLPHRHRPPGRVTYPGGMELSEEEIQDESIRGFGSDKLTERPPHHKKRLKQAVDIIDALLEEHASRTYEKPEDRQADLPDGPVTYMQPEGRQAAMPNTTTPEPETTTAEPSADTEEGVKKKEGDYQYYYYVYEDDEEKDPKPKEAEPEPDVIDVSEMPVQDTPPVTLERDLTANEKDSPNPHETVSRARPGEYSCVKKDDGVHGAGCRAFYRCRQEVSYFVECNSPFVYNKRNGKCGKPDQAPAPCGIWRDCSEKVNRKYADVERGCHHYYTCWHGFFMGHNECNPGLVFNEDLQYCDWPENVVQPCGTASPGTNTRTAHHSSHMHYTG